MGEGGGRNPPKNLVQGKIAEKFLQTGRQRKKHRAESKPWKKNYCTRDGQKIMQAKSLPPFPPLHTHPHHFSNGPSLMLGNRLGKRICWYFIKPFLPKNLPDEGLMIPSSRFYLQLNLTNQHSPLKRWTMNDWSNWATCSSTCTTLAEELYESWVLSFYWNKTLLRGLSLLCCHKYVRPSSLTEKCLNSPYKYLLLWPLTDCRHFSFSMSITWISLPSPPVTNTFSWKKYMSIWYKLYWWPEHSAKPRGGGKGGIEERIIITTIITIQEKITNKTNGNCKVERKVKR